MRLTGRTLEDCVVARLPVAREGAKPATPTAIRSTHAVVELANPARAVTDLGAGNIVAVDFADGVQMDLKEP
jgi:hypothetical protein